MTTLNDLFPSKYLKAADIGESDLIVTIKKLVKEELGQDRDEKPVLYFSETDKGLVLNKTNAESIAAIYGNDLGGWVGKRIALYATEVSFAGKVSMGIRVRLRAPAAVRKAAPVIVDEEFPEVDTNF